MQKRLRALAYRMLGTVADVDDVLQDAALKLHSLEQPPQSEEAFLYRVVSNLCLDRLRHQAVRKRHYVGPWLPEPLPDELVDTTEQLSMGLMHLYATLSPTQRVVFVLREYYDYSFAEIAQTLQISVANARQHASRAKTRLRRQPEPQQTVPREQKRLLESLLVAVYEQDTQQLIALMSEDIVALTDGGGVVSAAIVPITEPQRVAQIALFLARKSDNAWQPEWRRLNGGCALLLREAGALNACVQLEAQAGLVHRLFVMRNPEKLRHLAATL